MAFTKTTWTPNALPAFNATQLNRIEQGIADAHPFVIADYTNQGGSFDIACASADGYARITLDGLFVLGGTGRELLGRINGATLLDNRTTYSGHGNSGSGFFNNAGEFGEGIAATAGKIATLDSWGMDVSARVVFECELRTGRHRVWKCEYVEAGVSGNYRNKYEVMHGRIRGAVTYDDGAAITSIGVNLNGAVFTGRVVGRRGEFA